MRDVYQCYYHASFGLYFYEMVHMNREFRGWLREDAEKGWRLQIENTVAFCAASNFFLASIYICEFPDVLRKLRKRLDSQEFSGKSALLSCIDGFLQNFCVSDRVKTYRNNVVVHPNRAKYLDEVSGDIPIQEAKDLLGGDGRVSDNA